MLNTKFIYLCVTKAKEMTTSKIQIGTEVKSSKFGIGVITKIITKSTGYVEVNYNGSIKKEMAFNLTDINGESLKAKPKQSIPTDTQYAADMKRSNYVQLAEHYSDSLISSMKNNGLINSDNTTNF